MARLTETSLKEINKGIIEAAQSMGASPLQIITKVLIPEALPSIASRNYYNHYRSCGIFCHGRCNWRWWPGDLAVRYGYQRYMLDIMTYTVIILVIMVQLIQMIGDLIVGKISINR